MQARSLKDTQELLYKWCDGLAQVVSDAFRVQRQSAELEEQNWLLRKRIKLSFEARMSWEERVSCERDFRLFRIDLDSYLLMVLHEIAISQKNIK